MNKRSLTLSAREHTELEAIRDRDPRAYLRERAALLKSSADWMQLRQHVEEFLDRFLKPAPQLLKYCGLFAD